MKNQKAKAEAEKIFTEILEIVGSGCEHDSYCTDAECNRIGGRIVCKVDYETAKKLAILQVKGILKEVDMYKGELNPRWQYWQSILTELEMVSEK